jgi:hypothetical protein
MIASCDGGGSVEVDLCLAEGAVVHNGSLSKGSEFLQKPVVPQTLLATVRRVLDRR